jgi:transposase
LLPSELRTEKNLFAREKSLNSAAMRDWISGCPDHFGRQAEGRMLLGVGATAGSGGGKLQFFSAAARDRANSRIAAPDLPPVPGVHATFARDHEYKRHGTLSLLAGIDLLTGKVHALVRDRHRSREFVEFLKLLDTTYPVGTAIKLILDNHSAHISRETRAWLATRPASRFQFTFTPKHGSWLNLIEGFFAKFARSVLRHIRVNSKHELKQRIMAGIDDVNRHPVIHTWSYKLADAA